LRSAASAASVFVLLACGTLLEQRVLLHGDAHQANDHVSPVRGLAARVSLLGLSQLRDQRTDGRDLREPLEPPPQPLEPGRAEARVLRQVAEADDQLDARLVVCMAEREVTHPRAVGRDAVAHLPRQHERAHGRGREHRLRHRLGWRRAGRIGELVRARAAAVHVLADVGREHHDLDRRLGERAGDLGEVAEPFFDGRREAGSRASRGAAAARASACRNVSSG